MSKIFFCIKEKNFYFHDFSEPAHSSGAAYKCHICHSTYSHPGNFKQHLLKHEREKRGMSGNDGSHLSNVLQSAFGEWDGNYYRYLRLFCLYIPNS